MAGGNRTALPEPYETEIARQDRADLDQSAARCGMLDMAGVTVGAAFVGTFASSIVIADILLHGGNNYSVISVDMRNPGGIHAVPNSAPGEYPNPRVYRCPLSNRPRTLNTPDNPGPAIEPQRRRMRERHRMTGPGWSAASSAQARIGS